MNLFESGHSLVLWAFELILLSSFPPFCPLQAIPLILPFLSALNSGGEPYLAISDLKNHHLTAFMYPDYFTPSRSDFYFVLLGGSWGWGGSGPHLNPLWLGLGASGQSDFLQPSSPEPASEPRCRRSSAPHLPTLAGMWLMLLRMVVIPERASCCTLVLRVALLNSRPLITPDMLPRLPRGSPARRENGDITHLYALRVSRYCYPLRGGVTEARRGEMICPRPHSSWVMDSLPRGSWL